MSPYPATRIADGFVDLVDPRLDRTRQHHLLDIVTLAVCAVIGGADSWVEVAAWGRAKRDWLEEWLGLPHGIPSHDTVGRVVARLDPDQFATGVLRLGHELVLAAPAEESVSPGVIAIDGKSARRSGDRRTGQSPLHLSSPGRPRSAWCWPKRPSPTNPMRSWLDPSCWITSA